MLILVPHCSQGSSHGNKTSIHDALPVQFRVFSLCQISIFDEQPSIFFLPQTQMSHPMGRMQQVQT